MSNHSLTPPIIAQVSQLVSSLRESELNAETRQFALEVAYAAAAADAEEALSFSLRGLLRRGEAQTILELYKQFGRVASPPAAPVEEVDEDGIEKEALVSPVETNSCQAELLLAAVAAHASQNDFAAALTSYIAADLTLRKRDVDPFLRSISGMPDLHSKTSTYLERLATAQMVHRSHSLCKHIVNLEKQHNSPLLEKLYADIVDAVTGPEPFIAAKPRPDAPIAMTEFAWATFLVAFLRRQRPDLATNLWEVLASQNVQPTVLTWNMVMDGYSDFGTVDEVQGAWHTMVSYGVQPDGMSYRALLAALFKARKADDAFRWLKVFEDELKPTAATSHVQAVYNSILHGAFTYSYDHAAEALALLDKMEKEGPAPQVISYNTALAYFTRQNDYRGMGQVINRMMAAKITGDVFTFSTILDGLLKAGRTDAADMVLNIMRRQGVTANVATYTSIISAQMKQQTLENLQAAMRMLDEMEKSADALPNSVTYTSIIAGLYRGKDWLSAEQRTYFKDDILGRVKKQKVKFHVGGYNTIIKASLESGDATGLQDGLYFYHDMARNGVTPTDNTWFVLLHGLREREEWQLALEVTGEIRDSGITPSDELARLVRQIRAASL
ncbi:Pentatricopeptide repeat-containing protein, mitochondrial [Mycena kentingensis (nom. inval.)]|nr:Pentatricopeptide repeat-containing protein, mitochondrial [Mycena kentingensis (nom. inval.)]